MSSILFEKPIHKSGHKCVDMHFHTTHSDGAASIDMTLKKIRKLNIGVAITDHNEISGVIEAFQKKKRSDFIIPAIEVNSLENLDLLFYFSELDELKSFFSKEIKNQRKRFLHTYKSTMPLSRLIKLSKKYDCLVSVAHPFGYSMRIGSNDIFYQNEKLLKNIDTIEAINGGTLRKNNLTATDYIKKHNKNITAGSDCHSIFGLGNVVTCSKAKTVKEFLNNIKKKKNYVIGQEMKFFKFGEYFLHGINRINNIIGK